MLSLKRPEKIFETPFSSTTKNLMFIININLFIMFVIDKASFSSSQSDRKTFNRYGGIFNTENKISRNNYK